MTPVDLNFALVNLQTGEALDPTPENAVHVLIANRAYMEPYYRAFNEQRDACVRVLVDEAKRIGKKTLDEAGHTVTIRGGPTVDYNVPELLAGLMECGCPPERINEAVPPGRPRKTVLKQLEANPNYAEVIARAAIPKEEPWTVSIK